MSNRERKSWRQRFSANRDTGCWGRQATLYDNWLTSLVFRQESVVSREHQMYKGLNGERKAHLKKSWQLKVVDEGRGVLSFTSSVTWDGHTWWNVSQQRFTKKSGVTMSLSKTVKRKQISPREERRGFRKGKVNQLRILIMTVSRRLPSSSLLSVVSQSHGDNTINKWSLPF